MDIGKLYEDNYNTLYRIAFGILRNDSDALDAIQQTFLVFLMKKQELDLSKPIIGWLRIVCANICKFYLRRVGTIDINILYLKSDIIAPDYRIEATDELESILKIVEKIKCEKYKLILEQKAKFGYSLIELQDNFPDIKIKKQHVHRAYVEYRRLHAQKK